ncbi:MAG: FAS1-like dehydratase domain-containing protein [Candidatus Helarchaeota archaeon]
MTREKLIQELIGQECEAPPFQVSAQHIAEYAECLGVTDQRYKETAFPAYAATFVLPALWHWREQIPKYYELVKNPRYIVHGGQEYVFTEVEIKPGDTLSSKVRMDDIFIKKNLLFLIYKVSTTNQHNQLVLTTTITIIVRPGGF